MIIDQFASNQNVVFMLALCALLVATIAICAPIVFAPSMQRRGTLKPVIAVAAVVAVVALVIAGWQFGVGAGKLTEERAHLRALIQTEYGLRLTSSQVDELVNGGRPLVYLPDKAAELKLNSPNDCKTLRLTARTLRVSKKVTRTIPDTYDLRLGEVLLPHSAGDEVAPVCDPNAPPSVQS
jgi:hypothetical protein